MDDKQEARLRRTALRLWVRETPTKIILEHVRRSRAWLTKWRRRYQRLGWHGLQSQSRRPVHSPTACPPRLERLIVQIRRRLARAKVGLVGRGAIRRELKKLGLGQGTPSRSTIQRVLREHGLTGPASAPRPAYFPVPGENVASVLHAADWTCRYLEDGPKVYAFHTLNLHTRACAQTIALNKSTATVIAHFLESWKTLGIPDFLQLDNDAAFCGGYKVPRVFGQFVRLCLYVGLELVFLPVAEPERNGDVEQLNGLWARAFWNRQHFRSFAQVQRRSPRFENTT